MIYKTRSGSVYQVDPEGMRVRRVTGEKEPTPRQGPDGEWKEYKSTSVVEGCLWFDWTGRGNGTLTSQVVETIEEN